MAKEKENFFVPGDEQPYPVPENWSWVYLDGLAEIIMGQSPEGSATTDDPSYMPLIGGAADMGSKYPEAKRYTKAPTKISRNGDIILCIRATLGQPIYADGEYCLGRGVAAVRPNAGNRGYFWHAFINFEQYLYDNATGSTFASVSSAALKHMPIPYPPLPEQQRIVDRIESLFAKLDEAKEKAQAVVDGFEDRKAAILHQAFTGELTAEWRRNNKLRYENYVGEARKKRDSVIQEKKAKKLKYLYPDDIQLPCIPGEWQYMQIGDIAWSIKDGPHYSPEYVEEGVPFITGGNVRPEGVDFANAKRITQELHKELSKRCHPEKGDMLYTKGGTTGIARVNTYDCEFSVWVHVAVIKFVNSVLPEYFQMVLNSPLCYEQAQKYTHGVGNQDLGLTRMINIVFPICSIAEQNEIVRCVGACIKKEQQVKDAAEQVISQIDTMKKAILARAFRGELGTNDPSEPPADIS